MRPNLLLVGAAALGLTLPAPAPAPVGTVDFPTSCTERAKPAFTRGLTMYHHMMYEEARAAFEQAATADPDCAMPQWGLAMTWFHPIWYALSDDATAKGAAAVARARELGGKTERERLYIEAAAAYYDGWPENSHTDRLAAWEAGQQRVRDAHPDDPDAQALWAIAHLATAPKTDKTFAHNRAAAAVAEKLHAMYPDHPAAVHYGIHAYDVPALAEQGLPLARAYDKLAPEVPHALHMPTHIFVRVGAWDDVIAWNRRSAAAALARPIGEITSHHYAHAIDYLVYAHLQKGEVAEARAAVAELFLHRNHQPGIATGYGLAAAPARIVLETGAWKEAAALALGPESFPWPSFPEGAAINVFARGIGAARSGDVAQARLEGAKLAQLRDTLNERDNTYWANQVEAQRRSVEAWALWTEGKKEEALRTMRAAADFEDSMDKHPVTPGAVLPARELLGDMLMESGDAAGAIAAYEDTLKHNPGRRKAMSGIERAKERVAAR